MLNDYTLMGSLKAIPKTVLGYSPFLPVFRSRPLRPVSSSQKYLSVLEVITPLSPETYLGTEWINA